MLYRPEKKCRLCEGTDLREILFLGDTPLADRLVRPDRLEEPDELVPLTLVFCGSCGLVQIRETVSPEVLFCDDYPYYSSVSEGLLKHFRESAEDILATRPLGPESLVVEAASNDGYMLRNFASKGIPVLGIDPASGPAGVAREHGIPTRCTFFSEELARELREERPAGADLFLANNVLAHVSPLNGFVEGIRTLLRPDGLAVIEVPYLVDLVGNCEFDTIYHQHLCYFSVTVLDRLFRKHGLFLNEVRQVPIHGGSLRLFVEPREARGESVRTLLRREEEQGVGQLEYYRRFAQRVDGIKIRLLELLDSVKRKGQSVAAYGAAAKATTLLSYFGIDGRTLEYVADKNRIKHGRFMGGSRLPIVPPETLLERRPDYVLLLAWNFAREILSEQQEYVRRGGRFIVPIPEPVVIGQVPGPE